MISDLLGGGGLGGLTRDAIQIASVEQKAVENRVFSLNIVTKEGISSSVYGSTFCVISNEIWNSSTSHAEETEDVGCF